MRPQPALPFVLRRDPATGLECCPTREESARLSPAALDALHAYLDEQLTEYQESLPSEGTEHSEPIIGTRDRLKGHFERIGRGVFIAPNLGIHYPGVSAFAPDLMAVLDVPLHHRSRWIVDAEGRGVDFVLEVLVDGDKRKDRVHNVQRFAELRIPEYFLFNVREQHLVGWYLETPESTSYTRIMPQLGLLPSRVLALEFAVVDRELRVWRQGAEVPSSADLNKLLAKLVSAREDEAAQARAEADTARAEADTARAEAVAARAALRRTIFATLRLRGLEPTADERAVIDGTDDTARLTAWADAAFEVSTVVTLLSI